MLESTQTLASRFQSIRYACDVRYRPSIIEVSATAIARRGFGFTSVSRGAKTARYSGGWHRGRGTPPRDENKIRLAVARRENPLIARSQDFRAPIRDAPLQRYAIDIISMLLFNTLITSPPEFPNVIPSSRS